MIFEEKRKLATIQFVKCTQIYVQDDILRHAKWSLVSLSFKQRSHKPALTTTIRLLKTRNIYHAETRASCHDASAPSQCRSAHPACRRRTAGSACDDAASSLSVPQLESPSGPSYLQRNKKYLGKELRCPCSNYSHVTTPYKLSFY